MSTYCVYHSGDFDGLCSAAIIKCLVSSIILVGVNHGQEVFVDEFGNSFKFEDVTRSDNIIMVDFTLQPFSRMIALKKQVCNLIWIDHHASEIKNANEYQFDTLGLCDNSAAACYLTWQYYHETDVPPLSVRRLSDYDIWNHTYPDTRLFQMGMWGRYNNTHPSNTQFWKRLFEIQNISDPLYQEIIRDGQVILQFDCCENERYAKNYAFDALFHIPVGSEHVRTLRAICCNEGRKGADLFDSVYNPDKHDIMILYAQLPSGKYTVSLYTTKDDIDCCKIAQLYQGGGHVGSAGMTVQNVQLTKIDNTTIISFS